MFSTSLSRWIFHLLLAVFLSNAANKFFVEDLKAEERTGFYERIFEFRGDAPDQYRILPLLALKAVCRVVTAAGAEESSSFHFGVLLFNFIFSFVVLEGFWLLSAGVQVKKRALFSLLFSLVYIYLQYTGWRPDTLGLLLLCIAAALTSDKVQNIMVRDLLLTLLVLLLAFSRADVALLYAVFFIFFLRPSVTFSLVWLLLPVATQFVLQKVLFPDAVYYDDVLMIRDNLSMYYLIRNPFTWVIPAVVLLFRTELSTWLKITIRKYYYFYILLAGYLLLVLVVGRINEFRLYLPFVPITLLIRNQISEEHGKTTRTI